MMKIPLEFAVLFLYFGKKLYIYNYIGSGSNIVYIMKKYSEYIDWLPHLIVPDQPVVDLESYIKPLQPRLKLLHCKTFSTARLVAITSYRASSRHPSQPASCAQHVRHSWGAALVQLGVQEKTDLGQAVHGELQPDVAQLHEVFQDHFRNRRGASYDFHS